MKRILSGAAIAAASLMLLTVPTLAETLIWGVQVDRLEQQWSEEDRILAWETEVLAGRDELKFVWQSNGEYLHRAQELETLENRFFAQKPVTDFFDLTAGVSVETPSGLDRVYGTIGLRGLAPQWIEVEATAYLSDRPLIRAELEYEALITNRITLQPALEIDLPLADDAGRGQGAFAPTIELGARLSYDLIDRAVVPYLGVQAVRAFGRTAEIIRANGEDAGSVAVLIGARFMF